MVNTISSISFIMVYFIIYQFTIPIIKINTTTMISFSIKSYFVIFNDGG